jgi:hypothetical protein
MFKVMFKKKEKLMGALYEALTSLSSAGDPELLDGFRRYEERLTSILTPAQLADYAEEISESGEIRILEELSAEEMANLPPSMQAIAARVIPDLDVSMENRRVVALLNQRGEHIVAPDLGSTFENREPVFLP